MHLTSPIRGSGVPRAAARRRTGWRPALHAVLLFLALACAGLQAQAYTLSEFTFDDPAQERDFRELIGKLRCLVCQNESLAASQADLAQDLRQEVYEMMKAGKSKAQILDFLVSRYGDFVLYDPPVKPSTYPLWYGPAILALIAAFFLGRALLRRKKARETEISAEEERRVRALLAAADSPEDNAK